MEPIKIVGVNVPVVALVVASYTMVGAIVIFCIVPNILLIVGVMKRDRRFVLPWIVLKSLAILMYGTILIGHLLTHAMISVPELYFRTFGLMLYLAIQVYFTLTVFRLYAKYKQEKTNVVHYEINAMKIMKV